MRNMILLFDLTPDQKNLLDSPMRLHKWVQSHFILKDKVKHDILFTLKVICSCWLQEKGDTYLADHGDKHNLFKYSFVRHPYKRWAKPSVNAFCYPQLNFLFVQVSHSLWRRGAPWPRLQFHILRPDDEVWWHILCKVCGLCPSGCWEPKLLFSILRVSNQWKLQVCEHKIIHVCLSTSHDIIFF